MRGRAAHALGAILICLGLATTGCATADASPDQATPAAPAHVAVAGMNGPTGMGLAQLMDAQKEVPAGTPAVFDVSLYGSADAITPKLVTGSVPIATVPVNLAAVLYAKTNGQVQLAAVNTLGVLYVVAKGAPASSITSLADLDGQTVWSTGKGTTPDYVTNYLLSQAGVTGVKLDYLSEASEVASRLVAASSGVAILPEPYVTTVMAKDPSIKPVIDLTQAWATADPDSPLVTGALVVNKTWADGHRAELAAFLSEYKSSIEYAEENPTQAGALIAKAGIVPSAAIAASAIPRCHLVYMAGESAKLAVDSYLKVLYAANPASVGGSLPGNDFYWSE